jgi:hypothetical protein
VMTLRNSGYTVPRCVYAEDRVIQSSRDSEETCIADVAEATLPWVPSTDDMDSVLSDALEDSCDVRGTHAARQVIDLTNCSTAGTDDLSDDEDGDGSDPLPIKEEKSTRLPARAFGFINPITTNYSNSSPAPSCSSSVSGPSRHVTGAGRKVDRWTAEQQKALLDALISVAIYQTKDKAKAWKDVVKQVSRTRSCLTVPAAHTKWNSMKSSLYAASGWDSEVVRDATKLHLIHGITDMDIVSLNNVAVLQLTCC